MAGRRSVAKSCLTLYDPMDCSSPDFPVHHHLPEFAQTPVHWVSDAIQPSHPLSSPSPPAFNPSQHWGPFRGVSSSHQLPDRRLNVGALLCKCGLFTIGSPWLSLRGAECWLWCISDHLISCYLSFFPCKMAVIILYPTPTGILQRLCLTLVSPWTVACQVPLSMEFFMQENWSGLPFPPPGNLPDPGAEPESPVSCIAGRLFTWWTIREVQWFTIKNKIANLSGGDSYLRNTSHYFLHLF